MKELQNIVLSGRSYTLPARPMPDHDVEIHAFSILAMLDGLYVSEVDRVLCRVREIIAATQIVATETVVDEINRAVDQE